MVAAGLFISRKLKNYPERFLMIKGTVKWFNATKGYGFIAVEGETDVFVHISAVQASGLQLTDGMDVMFEKIMGKNGKYAAENITAA